MAQDFRNQRRIDCNPLRDSLPTECVTRRRPIEKKVVAQPAEGVAKVDMEAALSLRPEARIRWLATVLAMLKDSYERTLCDLRSAIIVFQSSCVHSLMHLLDRKFSLMVLKLL